MKNVENIQDKTVFAVVTPFRGVGDAKLILHEATITPDGSIGYGHGDTWVVDPAAVTRVDRATIDTMAAKTTEPATF